MNDVRVASRYAKSLLQLSIELDQVEAAYNDMLLIKNSCSDSKELSLLLKSPLVKPDKKRNILNEVFEQSLTKVSQSFVDIITKKKRENLLEEIANQFVIQYKVHKQIEVAYVKTAVPLNDQLRKEIPKLVRHTMNSDAVVELIEEVDEQLIGGIILRVGGKQLDDSMRKQLRNLEMEFSKNPYVKKF